MDGFDFAAPAELFCPTISRSRRGPLVFRRFATSAEAIRFAVEDLDTTLLYGTVLEVDETRFDAAAIRELYESNTFPLPRGDRRPL
jgi:hypothetical protein